MPDASILKNNLAALEHVLTPTQRNLITEVFDASQTRANFAGEEDSSDPGQAAERVNRYIEKPDRLLPDPDIRFDTLLGYFWSRLANNLLDEASDLAGTGGSFDARPSDPSFLPLAPLICFGLENTYILKQLVARIRPLHVILLDSSYVSIARLLSEGDWGEIANDLESRSGSLTICAFDEPLEATLFLQDCLRRKDWVHIWGAWLYRAEGRPDLTPFHRSFKQDVHSVVSYNGFIEDELLMLCNSLTNRYLSTHTTTLQDFSGVLSREQSIVIIVASGPSLDRCADQLRACRDRALVISCGTALVPLIKMGIVPDLHCELENVHFIASDLEKQVPPDIRARIPLLVPWSVSPEIPLLFGPTIYFARSGAASNSLLPENEKQYLLAGRSVTVAACIAATVLGAKTVALVGCDFGSWDTNLHHARGSLYERAPTKGSFHGGSNITLKGRDGVKIASNRILFYMKVGLEQQLRETVRSGTVVKNCGFGAELEGASWADLADVTGNAKTMHKRRQLLRFQQVLDKEQRHAFHRELHERATMMTDGIVARLERIDALLNTLQPETSFLTAGRILSGTSETDHALSEMESGFVYGSVVKVLHAGRQAFAFNDEKHSDRIAELIIEHLRHGLRNSIELMAFIRWYAKPDGVWPEWLGLEPEDPGRLPIEPLFYLVTRLRLFDEAVLASARLAAPHVHNWTSLIEQFKESRVPLPRVQLIRLAYIFGLQGYCDVNDPEQPEFWHGAFRTYSLESAETNLCCLRLATQLMHALGRPHAGLTAETEAFARNQSLDCAAMPTALLDLFEHNPFLNLWSLYDAWTKASTAEELQDENGLPVLQAALVAAQFQGQLERAGEILSILKPMLDENTHDLEMAIARFFSDGDVRFTDLLSSALRQEGAMDEFAKPSLQRAFIVANFAGLIGSLSENTMTNAARLMSDTEVLHRWFWAVAGQSAQKSTQTSSFRLRFQKAGGDPANRQRD